jgi:hypothetical protein
MRLQCSLQFNSKAVLTVHNFQNTVDQCFRRNLGFRRASLGVPREITEEIYKKNFRYNKTFQISVRYQLPLSFFVSKRVITGSSTTILRSEKGIQYKDKVFPLQATETYTSRNTAPLILKLGSKWR